MGIIQNIINKIRRGGAKMGMVNNLSKVTDHPKISINQREYERIEDNLKYFEGRFKNIKYRNSDGHLKDRPYISLNMAKVVSRRLASIVFNEQMDFVIENNQAADDFAHEALANNGFVKNFEVYLESSFALGGLAMRPYFDGKKMEISYAQAPVFFPLKNNTNDVSEAAIVTTSQEVKNNRTFYYTLIEFHEWIDDVYTITNELYESDDNSIVGIRVPLKTKYDNLDEIVTVTGLSRPLFTYLKPFGMNNKDINSPLGVSIYDNAKNTLKQINDAYDQFNWEVQLGQRHVAVPTQMVKVDFEGGEPREIYDENQNVFININGNMDDAKVVDLTSPIRSDDYISAINHFLKTLELELGLSTGSFSFDGQSVKTATQVVSENSMTYQTRNSHLSNVERSIKELIISILELAKGTTSLFSGNIPTLEDIHIDFDDGVFVDKKAELDYWALMAMSGFTSKQYAMERLGIPDDKINEIMKEIKEEVDPDMSDIDSSAYDDFRK